MFQSEKKKERSDHEHIETVIGETTKIEGRITASETMRIDGYLKGDAASAAAIIIGETGEVKGNVEARSILVAGKVRGNLKATDKIELTHEGSVTGDVSTRTLLINEGAVFIGNCIMETEDDLTAQEDSIV